MTIERIIEWGNINPKKLFRIDGLGAVLSAILLGIVLVKLEYLFGIPKPTLYFLASLPCLFAVYDFYCYFKIDNNLGIFLKRIAVINLIYCCLSIGLAIYHREDIKILGWVYILMEVAIVSGLSIIELKVAKRQN
ncbi:MAG: hypothetical protein ACFB10_18080 [Salibacteraceae bacterium]